MLAHGRDSNVFTQVAWLFLVCLPAKGATLVVEFAGTQIAGLDPLSAPIVMTHQSGSLRGTRGRTMPADYPCGDFVQSRQTQRSAGRFWFDRDSLA